jgi:hypothetical protein
MALGIGVRHAQKSDYRPDQHGLNVAHEVASSVVAVFGPPIPSCWPSIFPHQIGKPLFLLPNGMRILTLMIRM